MRIPIYQVDAFTDRLFGGNPAAVCPLEAWLPDATLQQIAVENNLAETAFIVPVPGGHHIRWFTPEIEMDLCGHATLASAHVLVRHLSFAGGRVRFQSASGDLAVGVEGDWLTLDFPSRPPAPVEAPPEVLAGIPATPLAVLKARDYLLVLPDEAAVRGLRPDRALLDRVNMDPGGICVTAPGDTVDFVSRFFTPQAALFEDPVTGSAHCSLIPYWAARLGRDDLEALQVSPRCGRLRCRNRGARVLISGQAVTYLEGTIVL